ncbi:MAG: sulfite exporter TauE/SafE family protein [Chromatiales bacterium]|nr:sulfite exporter TauE/SafE family protein [Chromatiales bacterium]
MSGLSALSDAPFLLLAGIVLFAGLVHGTLGLGFPMVATPLLALSTDVRSAILITLLPTVAVNLLSIWRGGNWSQSIARHWPLAVWVAFGGVLGSLLILRVNPEPFRLLLAAMILFYLWIQRHRDHPLGLVLGRIRLSYALFGLLAGFLAGTVNVMVPVLIVFALEIGLVANAMVQVFNLCFLTGKATQIAIFATDGILNGTMVAATLPLALVAVLALLVGMRIRDHIPADRFRRWLKALLGAMAGVLIVQTFL